MDYAAGNYLTEDLGMSNWLGCFEIRIRENLIRGPEE